MVVGLLAAVGGLVKARTAHTTVDSHVFKLHYRWTSAFCFIACALVSASDFIGDPIMCMDGDDKISKPITTFCWIKSTFTINSTNSDKQGYYSNRGSNHHGLGQHDPAIHQKTYQAYYQWVPFVLFIQGCLFYLPHLLWKANENKMADSLLQGLNQNSIGDDVDAKKDNIIKYLKVSAGQNGKYSVVYLMCEVINFVNVIGQMFLLDGFFGGVFMEFGSKVINFAVDADDEGRHDPLVTTFPRVTMCSFHKYGSTATIENKEALCILPQNILNEKIFIFMWFWFVALATITAAYVVWRVVLMASPEVRVQCMLRHGGEISAVPGLEDSIRRLHLGDFFLLDILRRNVDVLVFRDIATGLVRSSLDKDDPSYERFSAVDEDDDDPVSMKRSMAMSDTPV